MKKYLFLSIVMFSINCLAEVFLIPSFGIDFGEISYKFDNGNSYSGSLSNVRHYNLLGGVTFGRIGVGVDIGKSKQNHEIDNPNSSIASGKFDGEYLGVTMFKKVDEGSKSEKFLQQTSYIWISYIFYQELKNKYFLYGDEFNDVTFKDGWGLKLGVVQKVHKFVSLNVNMSIRKYSNVILKDLNTGIEEKRNEPLWVKSAGLSLGVTLEFSAE